QQPAEAAAAEEEPAAAEGGRPKRRRTAPVDYVALNAQLDAEAKSAGGGAEGSKQG
ncbi:hypothetical protein MNEG_14862, partial [Monoraphidium neglectum]